MHAITVTVESSSITARPSAILRLLVRNHPGVMSHVCGLFARRGFNVEGILCLPVGDGTCSVILLVVNEEERLEQLMRQLCKLEDVIEIRRAPEAHEVFAVAGQWLQNAFPASKSGAVAGG
jgi:acetolactate synthase-1/3 small subunit